MKTNIIGYILAFSAGGAIGATVAYKLLEEKYERIAQEKIKSIKEAYTVPRIIEDETNMPVEDIPESNNAIEHQTIVQEYISDDPSQPVPQYTDYTTMATKPVEFVDDDEPYVIEPITAGDDDYEITTYTLYGDGVLADEMNMPVEDISGTVGRDYAEHFGEYDDEAVYIRNDRLRTDFEVLREGRTYAELMTRGPRIGEDD